MGVVWSVLYLEARQPSNLPRRSYSNEFKNRFQPESLKLKVSLRCCHLYIRRYATAAINPAAKVGARFLSNSRLDFVASMKEVIICGAVVIFALDQTTVRSAIPASC